MKEKLPFFIFCLLAGLSCKAQSAAGDISIGVISDVHVMAPELVEQDGAAFQTYLSSDRKMLKESADIAVAMKDKFLANRPDILIVSGDLTKDGEKVSHELFISTFRPLVEAGTKIIVIPGNHDINNPHAVIFRGDETEYAATVTASEFAEMYDDFGFGDAISKDTASLSYVSEPVDGLRIFAIDACKYYDNTFKRYGAASDSCVVYGALKESTMEWIRQQTAIAKNAGKQIIGVVHHNFIEHFNSGAKIMPSTFLDNYVSAQQLFLEVGIPIVFTGHFHSTDIKRVEDTDAANYVYEVETGSLVTYPCPYRLVTLNKEMDRMDIDTKFIDSTAWQTGGISFQQYAKNKFSADITNVMKTYVDSYYNTISSSIPSQYSFLINMPSREDFATLAVNELAESVTGIMLAHNEGNEHLKDCSSYLSDFDAGIDNISDSLSAIPGMEIIVSSVIKSLDSYKHLHDAMNSIASNAIITPSVSDEETSESSITVYRDIINDLSSSFSLPRPTVSTGIESTASTDKFGGSSSTESSNKVQIYSIDGRIIDTVSTPANATQYKFNAPGVYILRSDGRTKKIVIK